MMLGFFLRKQHFNCFRLGALGFTLNGGKSLVRGRYRLNEYIRGFCELKFAANF